MEHPHQHEWRGKFTIEISEAKEGHSLPGGPIPPYLDLEASLLPPKNEEICASMSVQTHIWPELESVPFYPLDMKDTAAGEWSYSWSQEFDQRATKDENLEYYPLDDEL